MPYEAFVKPFTADLVSNWSADRWNWKRAVRRDARLSDAAKVLAAALCDDFAHHETAFCNPLVETLAEALAKSTRSVQRALAELKDAMWVAVAEVKGRGRKNEISFLKGDGTVAFIPSEKVTRLSPKEPEKVTAVAQKGDRSVTPCNKDKPTKNQKAREAEANEDPRQPHQRAVVPHGSHHLADWNAWLASNGFSITVEQIAPKTSDAKSIGFDMPTRVPPEAGSIPERIACRYVNYLLRKKGFQ